MKKITKKEFYEKISSITEARSITGKLYSNIRVCGNECTGTGKDRKEPFVINMDKLYEAYIKCDVINTSALKPFVDRRQSPAYAILMAAGLA